MKYDVSGHMPSQVEALINSYQRADVPGMERAIDNINNLIKDKKFKDNLKKYDIERHEKITEITKKALEGLREILKEEDTSTIFIDVDEIRKDMFNLLEETEKGYWNAVKEYITLYINQEDETDEEQS
jgi:hypothetical protein